MPEELWHRAETYASRYQVSFLQQLGVGIHGLVIMAETPLGGGRTAIKFHREQAPYRREVEVYQRLLQHSISKIEALKVPQLLRFDNDLLAIEMTMVKPPYLLDFAGAYLDQRPQFSEEIWQSWENDKQEQFGARWPNVVKVTELLEQFGIYLVDISPSNIAFE